MPPTGSTFTDWQQVEQESRLLMNEDFSWSEPPQRRRRRITEEPIRARRRAAEVDYEPQPSERAAARGHEAWDQPTVAHSHFDEMMEQWNAAYGDGATDRTYDPRDRSFDSSDRGVDSADHGFDSTDHGLDASARGFDLADPGVQAGTEGERRTVLITGRGDERYMPAPRRPRAAELRLHERSTFSPDRAGLWAVLLGIALVFAAIVH